MRLGRAKPTPTLDEPADELAKWFADWEKDKDRMLESLGSEMDSPEVRKIFFEAEEPFFQPHQNRQFVKP